MKNITLNTTNRPAVEPARVNRSDRWKAWPFLVLMLSSGMPLNYKLSAAQPMTVADVAELTQQATSDANVANSILFVLFLGGLYAISAWMLLKKPKAAGSILQQQWPLVFLLIYIAVSVSWSYDRGKVLTNIVHNTGIVLITLCAAMYYRHDPWAFPRHLGYILGINMMIHILAVIAIPAYAIDWQSRWNGLTTHPNTLGAMAFTTLWANASVLICKKSNKPLLHLIFSAAAIAAMIGADSVTSMMTSLCVVGLIFLFKALNRRGAGQRFYVGAFVIAILIALIFTLIGSAFDTSGLFHLFGRDNDFTGRTSVWEDARIAIQTHPLLGWSFDDHAYLIQKGFQYPSFHNGYLDIAVSGGIISVVLFLFLLGTWATGFVKRSRIARNIAPFSASFVIAYLIHNLTESSLIAPRGQLWQIFLVLVFLGACKKWRVVTRKYDKIPELSLPPLQIDAIAGGHFHTDTQRRFQGGA